MLTRSTSRQKSRDQTLTAYSTSVPPPDDRCSARIFSAVSAVELDADHRLEVGLGAERPARQHRRRGPAVPGPEPLDGDGVDLRVARAGTTARTSTACRRCRSRAPCRRGVRRAPARAGRARSPGRRSRPSARARRRRTRRAAGSPGRCPASTETWAGIAYGAGPARPGRGAARRRSPRRRSPRSAAGGSRCRSPGRGPCGRPTTHAPASPSKTRPSGSKARFSTS